METYSYHTTIGGPRSEDVSGDPNGAMHVPENKAYRPQVPVVRGRFDTLGYGGLDWSRSPHAVVRDLQAGRACYRRVDSSGVAKELQEESDLDRDTR